MHVSPVTQTFHLRAGEPVEDLPDLRAMVTYREVNSLEPLSRAIRDGHADVHAEVHAQLELNLFQRLALFTAGVWVTVPVNQQVAIGVPGGTLGRAAAIGVLTAAEPVWVAGQAAREWRQNQSALASKVRGEISDRLVALEITYQLNSREGEHASMHAWSMGVLVGNGEFIAPAEAVQPWSFDPSVAEALAKGDVTLDESKVEMLATFPADNARAARTVSLQRKELRIVRKLEERQISVSAATKRTFHFRFRNSDSNIVLCEVPALKNLGAVWDVASESNDAVWRPAAVVRLDQSGSRIEPTLWLTEARFEEDGRYHIKDLVDSAAVGSPLWIDGGIVGLLQDEGSAVEIRSVLKKLHL